MLGNKFDFNYYANRLPLAIGFFLIIFSIVVILGWFNKSDFVHYLFPITTALNFLLCGISLISTIYRYRYLASLTSFLSVLFSLASLLTERDLSAVLFQFPFSGTMAPNTSLCFMLAGSALFIQNMFSPTIPQFFLIRIFCWIVFALAIVALFGYFSGLQAIYGWVLKSTMAPLTSLTLIFLAAGILLTTWKTHLTELTHAKTIPWLPLPIFICILIFSICLWYALKTEEYLRVKSQQRERAETVKRELQRYVDDQIEEIERLIYRWNQSSDFIENQWAFESSLYLQRIHGLKSMEVIDSNFTPKYIAGTPLFVENSSLQDNQEALKTKRLFYVSWPEPNAYLLSIFFPLNIGNQKDLFLVTTFNIEQIFQHSLNNQGDENNSIEIVPEYAKDRKIKRDTLHKSSGTATLNLGDTHWEINVIPTLSGLKKSQSILPLLTLLVGGTAASLVSIALFFYYKARAKNEELQKAMDQLGNARNILISQEKLASLGTLTAGIAHEIKNPLNLINNFTDVSQDLLDELYRAFEKNKGNFSEEGRTETFETLQYLKKNQAVIMEQGKKANGIIQRMLAHSRTSPGQFSLTDINLLLDQYLKLSYYGVKGKDPTFSVNFEKDCDPSLGEKQVIAEDISSVFLNIFNNAYYTLSQKKQTAGEQFTPTISLQTKNCGDQFEIRIRDNGSGITKEAQEKIFTPFYTTKPPGEGTGLGLSLCHNIIVREHGGSIEYHSIEGQYTEFIIKLPNKPNSVKKDE